MTLLLATDSPSRSTVVGGLLPPGDVSTRSSTCVNALGEWLINVGFASACSAGVSPSSAAGGRLSDDAFRALELVPGALARRSGVVRYRPEFDDV